MDHLDNPLTTLPVPVLPGFILSQPGGAHGSVVLLAGPDRHPGVIDPDFLLVLPQMTPRDLCLKRQHRVYTLSTLMSHTLEHTQPGGATVPNYPVVD